MISGREAHVIMIVRGDRDRFRRGGKRTQVDALKSNAIVKGAKGFIILQPVKTGLCQFGERKSYDRGRDGMCST